jgi:NADH:ubiquinone oxidoreductase subunit 4 (subunit M)
MFSTSGETELPSVSITGKLTLIIITFGILVLGLYPGWLIDFIVKYAIL